MSDPKSGQQSLLEWLKSLGAIDAQSDETVLTSLKRLDLSNRSLEALHEDIGALTQLTALNLSNNLLTQLPESFSKLTHLLLLDLRRNHLRKLPKQIESFALSSLNISANKIEEISALASCTTLRTLDASSNFLHSLTGVFDQMNQLRSINLEGNLLGELEFKKQTLQDLEILNVSHNRLTRFPVHLQTLESLSHLYLSNNSINDDFKKLCKLDLQTLDLSSNALTHIEAQQCYELEELILDDNPIAYLRCSRDFAPKLQRFSAEGCALREFVTFASKSLNYLCLSSNEIERLPLVCEYMQLQELDIDNNRIKELPKSFYTLPMLKALYIEANPLSVANKKEIEAQAIEYCDIFVKKDITIQKARIDDVQSMAQLLAQLFEIETDFTYNYEKHYRALIYLFDDPRSDLLVAKHKDHVIGMVTMQSLISSAEGGYAGLLEDLVVDSAFRKMGVGTRLVRKLFEIARDRGYVRIQLAADKHNEKALRFYRQRGFSLSNMVVYHYVGV